MRVGGREIGGGAPCFIVAEVGLAHEGDYGLAKRLVDLAVVGGADAVKFQVYRTEELVSYDRDPEMFDRFRRKELPYEAFTELKQYAEGKGIIWFATPHTVGAFEFLRDLGVGLWKVGSGDRGQILPLVLGTGKPVFVSLGMRGHDDIYELIGSLPVGKDIVVMHCVSLYPVPPGSADLGYIRDFLLYDCADIGIEIGYSDHLAGSLGVEVAVALGAKVIEKHVCLLQSTGGDVACALNAGEFRGMVTRIRRIEEMLGDGRRHYSELERETEKWALKGKGGLRPLC